MKNLRKAQLLVRGSQDDGFATARQTLIGKEHLLYVVKPERPDFVFGAYHDIA